MTKINLFMHILFLFIAITFCAISNCSSALSTERLCYDQECSVPVSLARTTLRYTSREAGILSFDVNVEVKVYSKEAGSRTDLWGIEVNGKRGYAPKTFLREYKVFHKNLTYQVPINKLPSNKKVVNNEKVQPNEKKDDLKLDGKDTTSSNAQDDTSNIKSIKEELPLNLNDVTPSFEVLDGTTLYFEHTKSPVLDVEVATATAVPNKQDEVTSTLSSRPEQVQSNIFGESDVLSEAIADVSKTRKEKNVLDEDNLPKFLASSEEVSDLPEITGVVVPPLGLDQTVQSDLINKTAELDVKPSSNSNGAPLDVSAVTPSMETSVHSQETDSKSTSATIFDSKIDNTKTVKGELINETAELDVGPSENNNAASLDVPTVTTSTETSVDSQETDSESTTDTILDSKIDNVEIVEGNLKGYIQTMVLNFKGEYAKEDEENNNESDLISKSITGIEPSEQTVTQVKTDETILKNEAATNEKDIPEPIKAESLSDAPVESDVAGADKILSFGNILKEEKTIAASDVDEKILKSEESRPSEAIKDQEVNVTSDVPVDENILKSEESRSFEALNDQEVNVTSDVPVGQNILKSEESRSSEAIKDQEVNVTSDVPTTVSPISDGDDWNLSEITNVTSSLSSEIDKKDLDQSIKQENQSETQDPEKEETVISANETAIFDDTSENNTNLNSARTNETIVNINVNSKNDLVYDSNSAEVPKKTSELPEQDNVKPDLHSPHHLLYSSQANMISKDVPNINEFRNRNLLNVEETEKYGIENVVKDEIEHPNNNILLEHEADVSGQDKVLLDTSTMDALPIKDTPSESVTYEMQAPAPDSCTTDDQCVNDENTADHLFMNNENFEVDESAIMQRIKVEHNYWLTLIYLSVTAITTLLFSLGYYYIENMRRDGQLIAKINKLEKELLVSTKECTMLNDNLTVTKDKLTSIEDESFGSCQMVLSLKADLEASQIVRAELEDQVSVLEKDLEGATEAGLELERMLREVLSSNNEVNPLAQSLEDLQTRLNAQQDANRSLTNALNLKTQEHEFDKLENESLSVNLTSLKKKCEELEVELTRVTENFKTETDCKNEMERTMAEKVQQLEMQIKEISTERKALQKELKGKEVEMKDLVEVINQLNSNNFDLTKLYDVSRIKAEATTLLEERNDLQIRLTEVEGAHNLLEEHVKIVKEEMAALSEQCKVAERDKKDAETRLEVLSTFFKEKEAQRQKDEAVWLQKQGEVVSTVERIQTMQNEIQNYKQQVEMLKREILDQEREYKAQISLLETKAHEQWVVARQVERRLEESKAEAGQLRNRLTLIEKNINDVDPEAKLHRLEANGETATSPPLFLGAESSSSPIMFTGSSGVPPPPPPSYMHCSLFPPYLPPPLPATSGVPPYDVGQRPPPLGGRLSSPPPMPLHPPASGRYDNAGSPPPPMSPHLLPPFNHHRSRPPPPFDSDHVHPPPLPPGSILPPPLGASHSWGEDSLPPPRNSGFHPHPRERRVRNDKGSLHSSGESLDKTHHSSKV